MQKNKAVSEAKKILKAAGMKIEKLGRVEESSLNKLYSKTMESDCAMLSAFRGELTHDVNKSRSAGLKRALAAAYYSVVAVRGSYIENFGKPDQKTVSEDSFFVQGPDDSKFVNHIFRLGAKYNQDSVLIIPKGGKGAYLLGSSKAKDAYLGFGKKEIVGSSSFGAATSEYFSSVGGRKFEFKHAVPLSESQMNDTYPRGNGWLGRMAENASGLNILTEAGIIPVKPLARKTEKVETYFETYSAAVQAALSLIPSELSYNDDEYATTVTHGPSKPSRGNTVRFKLPLYNKAEKHVKFLVVSVYNRGSDSKPFELTAYVS